MPRPPGYRIIYNWDGAPHGYSKVPQSMDDFLNKVYAPLENTQVGALFWCVGEHSARWPSQVLEILGDVHERRYENAQNYIFTENIRRMLERGEDPQKALIEKGHQLGFHVYASIRMNDNHFNGAQVSDLGKLHHTELTRLRIEHPEWLLGDQTSEWFNLSWNMAIPEVRQHRLAHIQEVCRLYDWDGVDLDWQRHAFHLPEYEAYRLRYLLTDLQRATRHMTNALAEERSRPFYLATRVAGSLEMCNRTGYDIAAWIDEDLVDILIPAGGAETDASVEVDNFVNMCCDQGIDVYPGLDSGLPDLFVGPENQETKRNMRMRAIASRYHKAGAKGIYVFNWHANRDSRRELLSRIGSIETLRNTNKIYAATHRFIQTEGAWRGAYRIDRIYGEVPVLLRKTITDTGPIITLDIADELVLDSSTELELRLRLSEWVQGDMVDVWWDGDKLQDAEVQYCNFHQSDKISDVSSAVWLCFVMQPTGIEVGKHKVKVVLVERHPQLAGDITLTDVELVINHKGIRKQTHENYRD